ncbi:cellulose biosynthesis protein CelD [Methylobacterium sp. Leaf465]|uniref:GNAT family N-acetyltransferase n=1 Tax=Methylobacterium sp. Leaf465 TaxID=1736385 RepID=UPI0006F717F4|nr:GNAT family N-acetyltransferase [Methylobacterium sp. Leaf465]KQT80172.1 cellulose biosynthesis protein CelD [Methylobacterium sp. Leaf465]
MSAAHARRVAPAYTHAITSLASLGREAAAWDDLSVRAGRAHPFFGRHVMQAHLASGLASPDMGVVVVHGPERLEAVLPFRRSYDICGLGRSVLLPFASPFITASAPLVAEGPDRSAILAALVEGLAAASGGRAWRWPLLSVEAAPGRDLMAAMAEAGWDLGEVARFARPVLDRRPDHAAFLDGHPHPSRLKDLRRRQRRLAEGGVVSLQTVTQGPALARAVEGFLDVETAGWKGAAGTAMACRPAHAAFARALFRAEGGPVGIRADTLSRDGTTLAVSLALVAGGTAYLLKTAYDETARAFAPGLVLEAEIVRALHAEGFADRLDSATLAGSALESLYRERDTVAEIVAVPERARGLIGLERRLRLARFEETARGEARRLLRR